MQQALMELVALYAAVLQCRSDGRGQSSTLAQVNNV